MALRFVGIDPETPGGNCPSVWVDEATGDFFLQGCTVTDEAILSEITTRSPLLEHETVVRLPRRMAPFLMEAGRVGVADT